jgi:putative exosortase-associated protein (TIGR04073 family)
MAVMLTLLCLLSTPSAWARTDGPTQETPQPTELEKRFTKLGRGVTNIAFGWLEIPLTTNKRLEDGHSGADVLVVGPTLGTVRAIMRTGIGIVEVLTFPVSSKEDDFGPWIYPEYVF